MIAEVVQLRPQPASSGMRVSVGALPTHVIPMDESYDPASPTLLGWPDLGQGDCLMPDFPHGTFVWIDPGAPVHANDLVRARWADEPGGVRVSVVKWLRRSGAGRWFVACRDMPMPIDVAAAPCVAVEKVVAWAPTLASSLPPLPETMIDLRAEPHHRRRQGERGRRGRHAGELRLLLDSILGRHDVGGGRE